MGNEVLLFPSLTVASSDADQADDAVIVLDTQGQDSLLVVHSGEAQPDGVMMALTLPENSEFVTAPPDGARCAANGSQTLVCEVPNEASLFVTVRGLPHRADVVDAQACATDAHGNEICAHMTSEPALPVVTTTPMVESQGLVLVLAVATHQASRRLRSWARSTPTSSL